MTDVHGGAQLDQAPGHRGLLQVGTLHAIAQVQQHFGNTTHADAADAGAGVVIPQTELSPARLAAEIAACRHDRGLVLARARAARALAQPAATRAVADTCLKWSADR